MYKILVTDPLSKEGLDILRAEKQFQVDEKQKIPPEELKKLIKDYDVLLVRSETKVTKDIIACADKLKVIGRAGVGVDNVDVEAASKKGIVVMNTPGGNTISTAEQTMTLLLGMARNLPQAVGSLKAGNWDRKKFTGTEVFGKTLGIVGLGRIGTEVAKRANAFGMKVIAYDPYLSKEKAEELNIALVDLDVLFKEADFITVHTPMTQETKHMISDKQMAMMKDGVRLVNCARGGIIDEAALLKAIESKKVAAAALDVYEKEPPDMNNPIIKNDRIVTAPHLGAATEEAQQNVSLEIAKQVADALLGRGIKNAVNAPSLDAETLKVLEPYINLGEKIGAIQTQIAAGAIEQVKIRYRGEIINQNVQPITIAVVKGLLTPILGETVNSVNALSIAKERGISVVESKFAEIEDFATLISVVVKTDSAQHEICGTLFVKRDPRIVKIDNYYVEVIPSGYMLFISNKDVPGIVGHVGTVLGKNNINIAGMTFGREKQGGKAVSVLNVDSQISGKVIEEIKSLKDIYDAKLVKL
jgi:D-3-phosphoglycerate dehydrogenase